MLTKSPHLSIAFFLFIIISSSLYKFQFNYRNIIWSYFSYLAILASFNSAFVDNSFGMAN